MDQLDPTAVQKLQCQFDTRYEYLLDLGAVEPEEFVDRAVIRERIQQLTHYERQALQARVRDRLRRLDAILPDEEDPIKSFEEPHITHEDLVAGVRIPDFYERVTDDDADAERYGGADV